MRYVLADLEQAGAEIARRAGEAADWLDAQASASAEEVGEAVGLVDLACYQALSATQLRLQAAADALHACVSELREADRHVAQRIIKGSHER